MYDSKNCTLVLVKDETIETPNGENNLLPFTTIREKTYIINPEEMDENNVRTKPTDKKLNENIALIITLKKTTIHHSFTVKSGENTKSGI